VDEEEEGEEEEVERRKERLERIETLEGERSGRGRSVQQQLLILTGSER
jgi:hypothetical protein